MLHVFHARHRIETPGESLRDLFSICTSVSLESAHTYGETALYLVTILYSSAPPAKKAVAPTPPYISWRYSNTMWLNASIPTQFAGRSAEKTLTMCSAKTQP